MSFEIDILRHAHAEPAATGEGDIARALSARGRADAERAGAHLRARGSAFAAIVCSPSARTRETVTLALPDAAGINFDAAIYDATPGTLLGVLDRARAGAPRGPLLLVGHNPGLEQLVALLVDGHSDTPRGLPTAGIARLRFNDGAELEPGTAELLEFWSP